MDRGCLARDTRVAFRERPLVVLAGIFGRLGLPFGESCDAIFSGVCLGVGLAVGEGPSVAPVMVGIRVRLAIRKAAPT